MELKHLINKSVYGTIGYISSQDDINLLEQYILYNLSVLKEFKQIVVATNYLNTSKPEINSFLEIKNEELWKSYFPDCIILDSQINRGHNFGTADLDNLLFNWCKENNEEWLCKGANDVIFQELILENQIEESDFYYLNGISYETLYLNQFDYNKLFLDYFLPQTNFYLINISKCDYLNDKKHLDETYEYVKSLPNYNGKIWEYIKGWSCEDFLKNCITRNNLSKFYLLGESTHNKLCNAIKLYKIGDPSHKNIMIKGICHFQYYDKPIIEI
jgi:hypothetical protein